MPARGDQVRLGAWNATVEAVARRRISWLQLTPASASEKPRSPG
jgi:Mg2+/Co2+ transporter CorC